MNGWAFPEVSKQTGQPREVNPNFRKFLPGSFLSIQPCSQNLLTESWGESILTERLTGGTVEAMYPWAQGPEEMCFSFEHQIPSKIYEKWVILIALQFRYTFYRPQTKRLRARKIGLQYKILSFTRHFGRRSPFVRRAVRQRGNGLRLLIFKSRSGSDKKRRNRLQ